MRGTLRQAQGRLGAPGLRGDNLAEVGDAGEALENAGDQGEVRATDLGIGIEDHYLIEERVDRGAQGGNEGERLGVVSRFAELCDLWSEGRGGIGKLLRFGRELRAGFLGNGNSLLFGLTQDVLDALKRSGDGG